MKLKTLIKLPAFIALVAVFAVGGYFTYLSTQKQATVGAVSASDWRAGNIISDTLFYDNNSMSVHDIQNFLNSKNPNCDTWGTKPASEYGRSDLTHAQYASMRGWGQPPFICLKDYFQVPNSNQIINNYNPTASRPAGSLSAAEIIKKAADDYGVSPKTLIVLLQKESPGPLPLDTWPLQGQYKNAMGYGCPDTAPCDPQYAGFYNQMMNAARQIKIYKDNPNSFRHKAGQTANVYYNPNLNGCGNSPVYIESKATAGLYNYTPYQPNQAALNNMYGTGDGCSAYGNRNFWRIYNDWFGSTTTFNIQPSLAARYQELGGVNGAMGRVLDGGYCNGDSTVCWQSFANGAIIYSTQSGAWESKGGIREYWGRLGYQAGKMGFPVSGENWDGRGWWQSYQNGAIIGTPTTAFWESMGPIRTRWGQTGYQNGFMGYPKGPLVTTADQKTSWQEYEKGVFIWGQNSGAWETLGGIRQRWGQTGYQTGFLGYPTSNEINAGAGGKYQQYQNGRIYWSSNTGSYSVHGAILARYLQLGGSMGTLGYPTSGELTTSSITMQYFKNGSISWSSATGILK